MVRMDATRRWAALLTVAVLVGALVPPAIGAVGAGSGAAPPAEPLNATFVGQGLATERNGTAFLWADGVHRVEVTTTAANNGSSYCLSQRLNGEPAHEETCGRLTGRSTIVDISIPLTNITSQQFLDVTLQTDRGNVTRTIPFRVITRTGDLDGDGLENQQEIDGRTDIADADTDGDGLADGEEVDEYGTNATLVDTDGDGLRDGVEISIGTDPTRSDTDGDGLADGEEVDEYGTNATLVDSDGDGLADAEEVALGTDPTRVDTDSDGLADGAEVTEYGTDPQSIDTDGDTIADGREIAIGSNPRAADTDGDLLADPTEILLGFDPTSPVSPWAYLAAIPIVAVIGYLVWRRLESRFDVGGGKSGPETPHVETDGTGATTGGGTDEYLTPEHHVHDLLSSNGDRMKQSEIVELTDWSKAKVSRVLSRMEDDGELYRYRVGRENVVSAEPMDASGE